MKQTEHKKLSRREQLFCYCYTHTGNIKESAVCAGYKKNPELAGFELLCRDDIAKELSRLQNKLPQSLMPDAVSGYTRLAFGSITDAIMLLYCDKPEREQLEHMDLFNIAEIKRPKDGMMEIKFFDRIRALEHLEAAQSEDGNTAMPFYHALEQGARAIRKSTASEEFQ